MEIETLLNPLRNSCENQLIFNAHGHMNNIYNIITAATNNNNNNLNNNNHHHHHHHHHHQHNAHIRSNNTLSESTTGIEILSSLSGAIANNNSHFNTIKEDTTSTTTTDDEDMMNSECILEQNVNNNNHGLNELLKELSSDSTFDSDMILSSPMTSAPTSPSKPKKQKIPKTPNSIASPSDKLKKPRKSYEVSKKLEILDEKTKHGMSFVVEKYHISRSIISRWLSNAEKYRAFAKKNLKKLHKGPKASFSMEQEQVIINKINECRNRGEQVNGETIKAFALELSKQLNNFSFKASSGWLENFKNRHNLQLK